MPFTKLGLPSYLQDALKGNNITSPYPIQEEAIPSILKGKDILGIAKTGSGKTASYVLPILYRQLGQAILKNRHINVLVLVPTRELAVQVSEVFKQYAAALPEKVKTMAVYGGVSINPQMKALQNVQILIATPGRLIDLAESNALHLTSTEILVLDEADKMLNLGFKDEMNKIFSLLPRKRQNLLFSATLNADLSTITNVLLNDPVVIDIQEKDNDIEQIEQVGYFVEEEKKGPLLRLLIEQKNLKQVLVFMSSSFKADKVSAKLIKNGIDALPIHGKKSQGARTSALQQFKDGTINVLVATDLLSRGIDIEYLPVVINYELPRSPKDYIHRIGRTGRADAQGQAISFVTPEDKHHFKVIQKKMKKWVTMIDSASILDS